MSKTLLEQTSAADQTFHQKKAWSQLIIVHIRSSRGIYQEILLSESEVQQKQPVWRKLSHYFSSGRSMRIKLVSQHRRSDMAAPTSALEWSAANILDWAQRIFLHFAQGFELDWFLNWNVRGNLAANQWQDMLELTSERNMITLLRSLSMTVAEYINGQMSKYKGSLEMGNIGT